MLEFVLIVIMLNGNYVMLDAHPTMEECERVAAIEMAEYPLKGYVCAARQVHPS